MTNPTFRDDITDLIVRYLSDNASPADVSALEEWVQHSRKNREEFLAFKKAWMLSNLTSERRDIETEHEWIAIQKELFAEGRLVSLATEKPKSSRQWLSIAATIALGAVLSFWLFKTANRPVIDEIVASEAQMEHRLADGSTILLNRQASLKYFTDTDVSERKVALDGDAFFEVARDAARPFIINTQQVEIEVLGTSFYVDSRQQEENIQVMVQSGSVALRHGHEEIILSPGETGTFDKKNQELIKQPTRDPNFLGWQSNRLVFNETSLSEVVFALNRHFQAHVVLGNAELEGCKLSATYAGQTLQAVIRILEKTLNIQAEESDGRIVLKGDACN